MTEPILFLVSRGLLEHKDRMGPAIWTYLWFLDRVTEDVPDGEGKFDGLVLSGRPFKTDLIATDLNDHVQTVLQNVRKLEAEGYVIRNRHSGNLCSFVVTNSKKWFWRRVRENTHSRESENTHSDGIDKAKTLTQSEPKHSFRVSENALSNKEDTTLHDTKETKSSSDSLSSSRKRKPQRTSLPAGFCISEPVRKWAAENHHTRLEERLIHFVGYARANGKQYADWDQAFQNAIRDDWAKLKGRSKSAPETVRPDYVSVAEKMRAAGAGGRTQ